MSDLLFRQGTWDRAIWDEVVSNKEYRLGVRFTPEDVVIDVGGHVGAFTYFALDRGAGRVLSVEADPANFNILFHNVVVACKAGNRCVPVCAAVGPPGVRSIKFLKSSIQANTGGGGIGNPTGDFEVPVLAFNQVLALAGPAARLVKLDCEGGEWDVFDTVPTIHDWVDAWVGEYHLGSARCRGRDPRWVEKQFTGVGYQVVMAAKSDVMGLFWAWKPGKEIL